MGYYFSFIIPVYNRPNEIQELLESFLNLEAEGLTYEILVVEDGSEQKCDQIVEQFQSRLPISYFYKSNSGPGLSRNFGMHNAQGDYFIILDSDVILPPEYLKEVAGYLEVSPVDCFGGADRAHEDFSDIQKAINFSMTSFLTTGGIRGNENTVEKFKPRSFNMGFSKPAFLTTGGYRNMAVGEDLDLSIRMTEAGFKTSFIKEAYVYHKRRLSWLSFRKQVYKFGMGRPILDRLYRRLSLFSSFPTLFSLGLIISIILTIFGIRFFLGLYIIYFLLIFVSGAVRYRSFKIGVYAVWAVIIQFFSYGLGYLRAFYRIRIAEKILKKPFPIYFLKSDSSDKKICKSRIQTL